MSLTHEFKSSETSTKVMHRKIRPAPLSPDRPAGTGPMEEGSLPYAPNGPETRAHPPPQERGDGEGMTVAILLPWGTFFLPKGLFKKKPMPCPQLVALDSGEGPGQLNAGDGPCQPALFSLRG